jgi:hypothetical protein
MTEYHNNMIIDHSVEHRAFTIRCPMWANDMLQDVPGRRWSKGQKAWMVPVVRQGVEAMRRLSTMGGVQITVAARKAIENYAIEREKQSTTADGFPSWYKHKLEPRKHQTAALNKAYPRRAFALFMDMQTGKTKTAIDLTAAHRMEGHLQAMFVLTKYTLRRNWIKQLGIHCPIPYDVMIPETGKRREFDRWMIRPHDFKIMIAGWESLSAGAMHEMCMEFVRAFRCAVVGDETTYISNHKAIRSERSIDFGAEGAFVYALTGTPILEGPMNLYAQFEFMDPEIIGIGDYYAFRNRYAVMGGYRPKEGPMAGKPLQIVGYQNMDELTATVAPHCFQVMKTEAYDLPLKRYKTYTVELTKAQREVYQQVKREGLITHGGQELVMKNVLEVALRLHQITGGYTVKAGARRRMTRTKGEIEEVVYEPVEIVAPKDNPKMMELMDIVGGFKKKQGIIWAVYKPEIAAIVKMMRAAGLLVGELHGGIPEADRQPMVDAFQNGQLDWIVGNASTGGMGYTMMASEVNIFYNNTFKMIDRVQAEDRAYGDGQLKSGIWIDIVAEKTVDVAIIAALELKQDLATYVRERITRASKILEGEA